MIYGDFVLASRLFGNSPSSLTIVGDDMLIFTDPSNRALQIVRTMKSNTSGVLTICQPIDSVSIQFVDTAKLDQCNDSFRPSLVRSQGDKILVMSGNRIIIFNITGKCL